ncbi:hypothetical protein ACWEOZ_32810 [Actinoplanes sp. NPDC004185]
MQTLTTNLKWWEALLCLAAGVAGGSQSSTGMAVISALAAGIAFRSVAPGEDRWQTA